MHWREKLLSASLDVINSFPQTENKLTALLRHLHVQLQISTINFIRFFSNLTIPLCSQIKKRITDSSVKDVGRNMSPVSDELPELNIQQARRASGKSDMIDYFASGDFQAGILAQSRRFNSITYFFAVSTLL